MKKNRRKFIKKSTLGILGLSFIPGINFAKNNDIKISILHTNDMHSHIHPFKSGRNKGIQGSMSTKEQKNRPFLSLDLRIAHS